MRLSACPLAALALVASGTRLRAPEMPGHTGSVPIYLLADPLHTSLVFDLRWLEDSGYRKPVEIGEHRFVAMSWGDETAYLQKRWLTPGEVYRALFTRTPSVMECIPFDWKVEEVCLHQRVYVAAIRKDCGWALANFLNSHSECDRDGHPVTIGPSSWGRGRLIRCPRHLPYDISRMCNNWTAEALATAGLAIDPDRVLMAWDVIRPATSAGNGFRLIWDPVRGRNEETGNIMAPGTAADSPRPSDRGSCR
jgi:hypothetical protein